MRVFRLVLLTAGLSMLLVPAAEAAAPIGALKLTRVPTANSQPSSITNGADGNRWFVEGNSPFGTEPNIGRITPRGAITEFPANPAGCNSCSLSDIVQGPSNTLYYTSNDPFLGRVTTAGASMDPVPFPTSSTGGSVVGGDIASHGNEIWVNDFNNDLLWRYDTVSQQFTQFAAQTTPHDVAVDANGIVWFPGDSVIGRLDPTTGSVSLTPTGGDPRQITVAANGDVWFTEPFSDKVGRLVPGATPAVTEFPVNSSACPSQVCRPLGIAASPSGASPFGPVWFTQNNDGNVAAITDAGVITEGKSVKGSEPLGVTVDDSGNPWYAMQAANKIAELQLR